MKKLMIVFGLFFVYGTLSLMATPTPSPEDSPTVKEKIVLCGHCGEVKGSEQCCKEGAETCAHCKLHKGSPGDCAMAKGKDVTLCGKCGEVAGSDQCCKMEGHEVCEGCHMFKGSPGCKATCSKHASGDSHEKMHKKS